MHINGVLHTHNVRLGKTAILTSQNFKYFVTDILCKNWQEVVGVLEDFGGEKVLLFQPSRPLLVCRYWDGHWA